MIAVFVVLSAVQCIVTGAFLIAAGRNKSKLMVAMTNVYVVYDNYLGRWKVDMFLPVSVCPFVGLSARLLKKL